MLTQVFVRLSRCDRAAQTPSSTAARNVAVVGPDPLLSIPSSLPSTSIANANATTVLATQPTGSRAAEQSLLGIRALQINMRHSKDATSEVYALVSEKRLDLLLLQEPYVVSKGQGFTYCGLGSSMLVAGVRSEHPFAAVALCNPQFKLVFIAQLSTAHCACAQVVTPGFSFYVVSHYFQCSDEIEVHLRHLEKVLLSLRGEKVLVSLDANARSSLWGPNETNERGAQLEDLIRALSMNVENDAAQPPTYWTPYGESYIDVTLTTPNMSHLIGEWKVRCDWVPSSDHRAVDIRLRVPGRQGSHQQTGTTRFNVVKADWEKFEGALRNLSGLRLEPLELESADDCERMAAVLGEVIITACEQSIPRKRVYRKSNPRWTSEVT